MSDDLDEVAVFEHPHHPAAAVVEQVKGFAGAGSFNSNSKGFFCASLTSFVVAVDGGAVADGAEVEHGVVCSGECAGISSRRAGVIQSMLFRASSREQSL
jgi:hypothetical protein